MTRQWNIMTRNWDIKRITQEIDKIAWAERDLMMDGYITWNCKKDLYEILWHVEEKLSKCSTYAVEEEYLKEHEVQKMWDILKDEKKN